jgi:predicted Zn-dependent protease
MNEAAAIDLAREAVELAGAAGAQGAEASVSIARRFHVEARERAIARLEGSTGKSLFMRVFRDGRKATSSRPTSVPAFPMRSPATTRTSI